MLEIKLVKNSDGHVHLNGQQVANVCELVGLRVGVETEGYQAQYSGKGVTLSVWAKHGVSLERFTCMEPREYTRDLTISQVRPAMSREVTVLISGLYFNTPDTQVIEYLERF